VNETAEQALSGESQSTGAWPAIANTARPVQDHCMCSIPIMRPRPPSADRLAPYLKSIDASRLYSNFGPLAVSLEDRLAEHYGFAKGE
jgi:hypothetical protein